MYSSLTNLNPKLMIDWYNICLRREWEEALKIQQRINRLFVKVEGPILEAGHLDPVIDKATAEASGFLKGNRKTRKPYLPLPEEKMSKLIKGLKAEYPELLA